MAKWIEIDVDRDLAAGTKRCLTVEGMDMVVCQVEGQLTAVANTCPHAGKPLGEGELKGRVLTCPYHGYAYDVLTGRNVDYPHEEPPVRRYPVRCNDEGQVQVQLPNR